MQQLSCPPLEELNPHRCLTPTPDDDRGAEPSSDQAPVCLSVIPRPFRSEPSQKDQQDNFPEQELSIDKLNQQCEARAKLKKRSLWPEIELVIGKTQKLEDELDQERQYNSQLRAESINSQEEIKKHLARLQSQQKLVEEASATISALREELQVKEASIQEQQELLANTQLQHLKRIADAEERIRKLLGEQRDNNEKVRKANLEAHKEKTANIELKEEMARRIEQLQSDKEVYLQGEIHRFKAMLEKSKEDRELALVEQIFSLKSRIYRLVEELQKKNIQLALMERKKLQAVSDSLDKKDQELKMQKSLFKSLQEKMGKLQEENKGLKNKGSSRNRLIDPRPNEQEMVFELSP